MSEAHEPTTIEIFIKFEKSYKIDSASDCWTVTKALAANGYGCLYVGAGKTQRSHRYSYEYFNGPVPVGLQIDHICRNRACVNPQHLRCVTLVENVLCGEGITATNARKTHCKRGHALAGDNLYIRPDGHRACQQCQRENEKRRSQRKLQAALNEDSDE